jgi:glycosyltransferase involved in cell wall biosynthesis
MRTLFLSPTLPWPLDAGGRIRTYQLLREVSQQQEVHLWAVRQPEAPLDAESKLREVCAELRVFERSELPIPRRWIAPAAETWFYSEELEDALPEAFSSGGFDLVHLDELALARSVLDLHGPPILVHHHKLDVELARALYFKGRTTLLETMRWRALEEQASARLHDHVFCTEGDAASFRARHPRARTFVVPNGVDLEYFRPLPVERDPSELLFLGSLDYQPNLQGLERFLELVWPGLREARPDLSLVVVGRSPSPEFLRRAPKGVHVIGDVDDVRPYLARAAALVVPLEIGGGSRLKIAEALAMECPILSTRVGAEGFGALPQEVLGVSEDVAGLSALLRELLGEEPRATRTSPLRSREHMGWSRSADALIRAWDQASIGAS